MGCGIKSIRIQVPRLPVGSGTCTSPAGFSMSSSPSNPTCNAHRRATSRSNAHKQCLPTNQTTSNGTTHPHRHHPHPCTNGRRAASKPHPKKESTVRADRMPSATVDVGAPITTDPCCNAEDTTPKSIKRRLRDAMTGGTHLRRRKPHSTCCSRTSRATVASLRDAHGNALQS